MNDDDADLQSKVKFKIEKTCPIGVGRTTSLVTARADVRREGRLLPASSDNATRRRLLGGTAIGPQVDTGYETPRRCGLTRTKAESFRTQ